MSHLLYNLRLHTHAPHTRARSQKVLLLHGAQLHSDDELGLGGHVLEHVGLQPPQHVRPQQVVELLDLVLLGDVGKLLQEAFKVTTQREREGGGGGWEAERDGVE